MNTTTATPLPIVAKPDVPTILAEARTRAQAAATGRYIRAEAEAQAAEAKAAILRGHADMLKPAA